MLVYQRVWFRIQKKDPILTGSHFDYWNFISKVKSRLSESVDPDFVQSFLQFPEGKLHFIHTIAGYIPMKSHIKPHEKPHKITKRRPPVV